MKRKSGSRVKHVFSNIINIQMWSDWPRMKSLTLYLTDSIKRFFVPQKKQVTETFAQAKIRLQLSDKELLARQKGLFRLSIMMLVMAFLLLCYAIYQFVFMNIMAGILSIIVMLIACVLAFRYHFWYFQMKSKTLGCTLTQWFKQGLLGDKR